MIDDREPVKAAGTTTIGFVLAVSKSCISVRNHSLRIVKGLEASTLPKSARHDPANDRSDQGEGCIQTTLIEIEMLEALPSANSLKGVFRASYRS